MGQNISITAKVQIGVSAYLFCALRADSDGTSFFQISTSCFAGSWSSGHFFPAAFSSLRNRQPFHTTQKEDCSNNYQNRSQCPGHWIHHPAEGAMCPERLLHMLTDKVLHYAGKML